MTSFLVLISTNLVIALDVALLRPVVVALFIFLLGFLLISLLHRDVVFSAERYVVGAGLSVFLLMALGLGLQWSAIALGLEQALTVLNLLVLFDLFFLVELFVFWKRVPAVPAGPPGVLSGVPVRYLALLATLPVFAFSSALLVQSEIAFPLIVFMISVPVIVLFLAKQPGIERVYPLALYVIGFSLLSVWALRSPHIWGRDVQLEYGFYFRTTLDQLNWFSLGFSDLDSCLSISLLPTVVTQLVGDLPLEPLFKFIFILICAGTPVAVYVTAQRFVGRTWAVLAGFYIMSSTTFLFSSASPRTNLAVFFASLIVLVLFSDAYSPWLRRGLLYAFIVALVFSHYTTTFVLFALLTGALATSVVLSRLLKDYRGRIKPDYMVFMFGFILFWYTAVAEYTRNSFLTAFQNLLNSIPLLGKNEMANEGLALVISPTFSNPVVSRIYWIVGWTIFILIAVGVAAHAYRLLRGRATVGSQKDKEYIVLGVIACGLLVMTIALPFVTKAYEFDRMFSLASLVLSSFVIIGYQVYQQRSASVPILSKLNHDNILIILVLVNFLYSVGVPYQLWVQDQYLYSSNSIDFDAAFVTEAEVNAMAWAGNSIGTGQSILTPTYTETSKFFSQGPIDSVFLTGFFQSVKRPEYQNMSSSKALHYVDEKTYVHDQPIPNEVRYSKVYANGRAAMFEKPTG